MPITLASADGFASALDHARDVAFASYRLTRSAEAELESAAAHGAHVDVSLAKRSAGAFDPYLAPANAAAAERLRASGATVTLFERDHLKAAVIDGVAWLDDRNFPSAGPDVLVRDDDAEDVAAIRATIAGVPGSGDAGAARLALDKTQALAAECDTIAVAGGEQIDCASESFGFGTISKALCERAAAGAHVRLLVDAREAREPRERAALLRMSGAGIEVRTRSGGVDKLAIADDRAWLGSANATYPVAHGELSDWGLVTQEPDAIAELRARYADEWHGAKPLAVAPPGATPA